MNNLSLRRQNYTIQEIPHQRMMYLLVCFCFCFPSQKASRFFFIMYTFFPLESLGCTCQNFSHKKKKIISQPQAIPIQKMTKKYYTDCQNKTMNLKIIKFSISLYSSPSPKCNKINLIYSLKEMLLMQSIEIYTNIKKQASNLNIDGKNTVDGLN